MIALDCRSDTAARLAQSLAIFRASVFNIHLKRLIIGSNNGGSRTDTLVHLRLVFPFSETPIRCRSGGGS